MGYWTNNYLGPGGSEYVIDGTLTINGKLALGENATVEGDLGIEIPKAEAQADSTASDVAGLVADFNALLAKLKDAGLMATT
jgi:hypothetical protein